MSQEERELRLKLATDFPSYARLLQIRTKLGQVEPLVLNATQRTLHARLEDQRSRKGAVRAIVLKGRQQGVSTYVGGRFYWRVTHRRGVRAFILSHTDQSTQNLFGFVDRFHANLPAPVKPTTGAANANELSFPLLDSGYRVATAGGREVGRSETIQYVHGSEVAFWPNASNHIAGIMQAVPEAGDTEIILESTAYGLGGAYHELWVGAERREVDFEAVFLPWFMHEEYAETVPSGWTAPAKWEEYARAHALSPAQLYWAWKKSRGMSRGTQLEEPYWQFRQEYPATAAEAFQTAGEAPFIHPEKVSRARKNVVHGQGPIVIGVDPHGGGRDGTGVIDRQGRRAGERICTRWRDTDTMVIVGRLVRLINTYRPARMFIDVGGVGKPLYDRLCELGYGPGGANIVVAVNFGGKPIGAGPISADRYANRKAEMWDSARVWFDDPAEVQCPDSDEYQMDVCAPAWGKGATKYDSSNRLAIEPKPHLIERVGFSSDIGDAFALTFAEPVYTPEEWGEDDDRWPEYGRDPISGY